MERRELTCISCPLGCALTVEPGEGRGDELRVTGNTCPRGAAYAREEVLRPVRTVTSTAPVRGGEIPRVSVKTAAPIPKEMIFACMEAIHQIVAEAPVKEGDVLLDDFKDTGVSIIATKAVNCKKME